MAAPILKFPHKALRAQVIVDYVSKTPYKGIVCITCGEAGKALTKAVQGTDVHLIVVEPTRWLTMEEIANEYPGYFDATSGHLPLWLMERIAQQFRVWFDENPHELPEEGYWRVPTGSGETIFELELMSSAAEWVALYDYNRGSKYEAEAPLNNAVATFFEVHYYEKRNGNDE